MSTTPLQKPFIPNARPVSLPEAMSTAMMMGNKVSVPDMDRPAMQGSTDSLSYHACMDTGLEDKMAFSTCMARFIEEAAKQEALDRLLDEGNKIAAMLYTWRCVSYGTIMVKSNEQENRIDIHKTTAEILAPEILKLRHFMEFTERASRQFCDDIKRLALADTPFVTEAYLLSLGKMINMFAVLDELKNIKAGMHNDFTKYKGSASASKAQHPDLPLEVLQKLQMFIANNNAIIATVKSNIKDIEKYRDVLCLVVNTCADMMEEQFYMFPNEKYGLVKVIAYCLQLIYSGDYNIAKLKQISISRLDKIIKQTEVVPLFGDMMISPFDRFIKACHNFNPSDWPQCSSSSSAKGGGQGNSLVSQLHMVRDEYNAILIQLTEKCGVRQVFTKIKTKTDSHYEEPRKDNKSYYDLTVRALKALSSWTARVVEAFSWKLVHPADIEKIKKRYKIVKDPEDYEMSTRYNYSSEEKMAMVELIGMIKSVQQKLLEYESVLRSCITRHMYQELQDLVQIQLREPLRKALKNKKTDIQQTILHSVRDICSDLMKGTDPTKDPLLKGKKDSESGHKVSLSSKQAPPSSTQLYLCRTMLENLVSKSATGAKKPLRAHLDPLHIQTIEKFLRASFDWHYLIDLQGSINKASDLSQLWFREFFLEMTKGQRVQYPIEMSVPWILTKHILEQANLDMIEFTLFPLELYNDSYSMALTFFHKQFLVDELEAEVSLVFDQLVFILSDNIFSYYKKLAATIYLDKVQLKARSDKINLPRCNRYSAIMRQTRIKILGREVNLRALIAERIREKLLKSIDAAIVRYEASSFSAIMELNGLLEVTRLTHQLLSQHLPICPFKQLWNEANESVTIMYGRVSQHTFAEVVEDVMPQFCYNSTYNRFVRTQLAFVEGPKRERLSIPASPLLWGSKSLALAYMEIYNQYADFIGPQHLDALLRWIGYEDIALMLKELVQVIKFTVSDYLHTITKTLRELQPRRAKLPSQLNAEALLEVYLAMLRPLLEYSDLRTKVFQVFREIGNGLLFCLQLENALNRSEVQELMLATLFMGILPKPYAEKKEGDTEDDRKQRHEENIKRLSKKHRSCQLNYALEKFGTKRQEQLTSDHMLLTKERMCKGLSLFNWVVEQLKMSIDPTNEIWTGPQSKHLIEVNDNLEFHRLWSSVQFVSCVPTGRNELTSEALFGDSLQWAGIALVYLLGQHRRFEAFDFCSHLAAAHKAEPVQKPARTTTDKKAQPNQLDNSPVNILKMVDRIKKMQWLNADIMSTLQNYIPEGDLLVQHQQPPPIPDDAPPVPVAV